MGIVDLSIVIPALDEEKSISELHLLITKSLDKRNIKYEIIFLFVC